MQIGILRCDDIRSSLSAEYGQQDEMIMAGFLQAQAENSAYEALPITFKSYDAFSRKLPENLDECDAYVITGSRFSVLDSGDVQWMNQLQNFIVRLHKAKIKTIGLCFGHQIIATALGGKIERAEQGWQLGVYKANITQTATFMQPEANTFYVVMISEDEVTLLPPQSEVLASSQNCPYLMVQYSETMLGCQGHPEFSKPFAKALLNIRKEEFPRKRFDDSIVSFNEYTPDNALLFSWFLDFLHPL